MGKERRKALKDAYKTRTVIGGIYCIKCSGNQRTWIRSTTNMERAKNRVTSSLNLKGAPEPAMVRECRKYGWESFSLTVLEDLKKGRDQTGKEFTDDIATLSEMWLEKFERREIN